jgi:hypothetical protein
MTSSLRALIQNYQKVTGARAVGLHIEPGRSVSPSFLAFVSAVRREIARAP